MASIGTIYLGGRHAKSSSGAEVVNSAVAFMLDRPAKIDWCYRSDDFCWTVELKKGQSSLVARTSDVLARDDIIGIGFEQVQRAMDIIVYETNSPLSISSPGDSHVLLFVLNDDFIIQHVSVSDIKFDMTLTIETHDNDGNLIPPITAPPSRWVAPLRYYRLSQTSSELYEAYRNLFLSLESLLHLVCPKTKNESEKKWFLRAFGVVGTNVDLRQFVPVGTTDPAVYLVSVQYEHIRCRLFHGKGELPATYEGSVNPADVSSAYSQLIRLWREVAQRYLPVRGLGGGVVTYVGFRALMDRVFSEGLSVFYTSDATPPVDADTQVSPLGMDVQPFSEVQYISETSPGHVSFVATQKLGTPAIPMMIHRVCSEVGGSLFGVSYIKDGIFPDNVDLFESYQTVRLVNRQQPRTLFKGSM